MHRVKRHGVAIPLDVVGPGGELVDPPLADFVGVAALGQHAVPHFAVGRMMFHIPLIWAGRGQDYRAAGLAERFDIAAQVAQSRGDQREDRVHGGEGRVGAPGRHTVNDDVCRFAGSAARLVHGTQHVNGRLPRFIDPAGEDLSA